MGPETRNDHNSYLLYICGLTLFDIILLPFYLNCLLICNHILHLNMNLEPNNNKTFMTTLFSGI